ncbi:MAG TPA: hypothetical protein VLD62_10160 [Acidimicrobiia bacterium]|nr:hypothetical protein [Acidimicrobiia bacterium]
MSSVPRVPVGEDRLRVMFEHNRELGRRFATLYGVYWREGSLEQGLKELIRMRNARMTDCGW